MSRILDRNEEHIVQELEKGVQEKWKWSWLDDSTVITLPNSSEKVKCMYGEFVRKIHAPGKATCTLCDKLMNYGKRGKDCFKSHFSTQEHRRRVKLRRTNYVLQSSGSSSSSSTPSTSTTTTSHVASSGPVTYGIPPAYLNANVARPEAAKPMVSVYNRVRNQEAMVLGVIAEHSLPFKMAPVMIYLAKELSKDKRALNHLHMDRTSASYKTTYGLVKTMKGETLRDLRKYPFSLNMDESTSTGNKRVVTVLVSYYNPAVQRVVIEHLESFTVIKVDAESLFNCVVELFTKTDIPWENLVSVLMDSCAVMRGKKSGLETRIREKVPHLIDVDGDVCHHMHNACSTFCKPFAGFASKLFTDIHNDLKWSEDLKEYFREVCEILDIKFTIPARFVSHRWLSVYDISISTLCVWDALQVFYYGFLPGNMRVTYQAVVAEILRKRCVTPEGRSRIREIQESLRVKWSKCTEDGQSRKKRIFEKVLYYARKTQLILCFFSASLALLKQYVCLFQTSAPMVHKLHDQQETTFRDFLSCFLKPEHLARLLKTVDLTTENTMKPKDMFLGAQMRKVIADAPKDCPVVAEFLSNVSEAYVSCGKYMQKKLPLDNELLYALSCIDPLIRGSTICCREMKKLPQLLPSNLSDEEEDMYEREVHQYQVDAALPPADATRLDEWWAQVFTCGRYVAMRKVIATALSIFHGPHVESSFNVMGDILDDSCRMNISTYSSLQCIKYSLRSRGKTAIEAFQRKDFLHDPVDRVLVSNMLVSAKARKRALEKAFQAKMAQRAKLNMPSTSSALSKAKAALLTKKQEKEAREAHKKRVQRVERAAKLKKLAAKVRQKKKGEITL